MNMLTTPGSVLTFLFVLFSFFTQSTWSSGSLKNTNTLKVGVAKINITPQTPIPMSGYGGRDEVFKGIHDSLFATAVVFGDGTKKAALITADLIGFSHKFSDETIDLIAKKSGITKQYILLSATHNHGGPVNNTYGTSTNNDVTDYVVELQKKLIEVVVNASNKLVPAQLGTGMGTCTMNINRRARLADGSIWLGRNPDGPCDHEVSVTRIDDMDNQPMAVLVNWPCHGTTGGQENYQITGDWPGAAAHFVENNMGEGVVVSVTAGASGDINPIYGPNGRFRDIDAMGMLLGEEVVRVVESTKTFSKGTIEAVKKTIVAKGKKAIESRFPNQELEAGDPVEINLSVLKVGSVVFAGISGEVMTEIGMRIKSQSPYSNTVVITHCNGSSGYLCTDKTYAEGGYEAMVTRTMPGTADLISDNLNYMIRSLR